MFFYIDSLFFLSKFKYEEWEIGSELSLFFVESLDEKTAVMINRHGYIYAKLIEVNLIQRLREYAEEICEPYVPIKDELCVAKYGTYDFDYFFIKFLTIY